MRNARWNESSTVQSLYTTRVKGRQKMSTERQKPVHPSIQFILENSPRRDPSQPAGFESITELCNEWGGNRKSLYSLADRGCFRLDTLVELCHQFRVPREKLIAFVMVYSQDLYDEYLISSKAS